MPEQAPGARPAANATPWWAALAFGVLAAVAVRHPGLGRSQPHGPGPEAAARRPADTAAVGVPVSSGPQSWKDILLRVYRSLDEDRVLAVAAGVTFYGLLSLFPAIVAMVSLYGLVADASTIADQLNALSGVLPGGALDIVGEQIKRITANGNGSLSFGFLFGLGTALWSANAGVKAAFDALNVAYGEREKRGFIVLNALSLTFTIGAIVLLLLAVSAVVVIPVVLHMVPLGDDVSGLLNYARWPILLLLVVLGFAVLYRFGPSRVHAEWRRVLWGSGFAAVAWLIGSALFSFYVSHFGSYNATYGSLGAAIGFMTWIWISATIVMIGAELNAKIEHPAMADERGGTRT